MNTRRMIDLLSIAYDLEAEDHAPDCPRHRGDLEVESDPKRCLACLVDDLAATIAVLRIQLHAAGVSTLPEMAAEEEEAAMAWGDMFERAAVRTEASG
jgi:hypothetical protein